MLIADAILPDGRVRDVRVREGAVAAVERTVDPDDDERVLDAAGRRLFPGAIDVHVHFREPGFSHKETWRSGSASAAAGGVTTVVDQPNTDPPTVTGDAVDEKARLAGKSVVDWGVNGGVTADWDPDSLFDRPLFALGEVFLADSTGEMGIEVDLFADAVERAAAENVPVTVHAEDAAKFDEGALPDPGEGPVGPEADADAWSTYRAPGAEEAAVERACEVAADHDAALHVAHTSTPEGVDAAVAGGATCEVTPHHLLLSRDHLDELGTFGRMNPPLRSERRRRELYHRVREGDVDVVATDHAPHTREEKETTLREAPSGVPGVETMVPLLLAEAAAGRLSYERVRDLVAANPAEIFGLSRKGRVEEGADADLVLVDPDDAREIRGEDLHSACGWTPFEGHEGVFPDLTLVRGEVAFDRAGLLGGTGVGDAIGINVMARSG